MGKELGQWIRSFINRTEWCFHLGRKVQGYLDGRVTLDNGEALSADLVVAGTGVKPRTDLARKAGLTIDNGVVVDQWLRTQAANVYAVGDIARFPDFHAAEPIRVEHWVHAERQGQHAAAVLLGDDRPLPGCAVLLGALRDTSIRYVGHAQDFDPPAIRGLARSERRRDTLSKKRPYARRRHRRTGHRSVEGGTGF